METARKERKTQLDKIIGQNINLARKSSNLSREELARIADLTAAHVGLIERGERGVTAVNLAKFSKIFNLLVSHFFAKPGKSPPPKDRESVAYLNRQRISPLLYSLNDHGTDVILVVIQGIIRLKYAREQGK